MSTKFSSNTNLKDIRPKNKKGEKEKDHMFCNEHEKTIYYAEVKSNLNLDTEKSKSTYKKCLSIRQDIEDQYPEYTIKMFLVSGRHFKTSIIPNTLLKRYDLIRDNVVGINEYLEGLGVNYTFTDEDEYANMISKVAKLITIVEQDEQDDNEA